MAEEKKEEVKIEEKTTTEKQKTKKKGNGGKIVMIVLVVLLVIALLCGGIGWFVYRAASDKVSEVEETWREVEQEVTRELKEMERDTVDMQEEEINSEEQEPKVDEELLQRDLLSDRFPEDIPLSGGRIRESSFDQWSVSVTIMTSSSVEDAYMWYEEAFENTDWILISKSRQDERASISFNNGAEERDEIRKGEVSIMESIWGYTNITIRERY